MSLKDPDDEYDGLIQEKSILPKGLLKKSKLIIFVLI